MSVQRASSGRSWGPNGTALAVALALLAHVPGAWAGGFETPDNGTQALGRGTAWVAKADDPAAIYHNPAGLARQRGTTLLVNTNILFHSYEFRRLGVFPDDSKDPATPWGGRPFPVVTNTAPPFAAPFLALATDFHTFDRLTFAVGVFGPPAIGNRTFPIGVAGAPSASRYDSIQSRSLLIYPSAAAAVRVTPWLDLGFTGHLVYGSFDQTTISFADAAQGLCKSVEDLRCDARGTLVASGSAFAGTFGALVRPAPSYAFGASLRTPTTLTASGELSSTPPLAAPVNVPPGPATLSLSLPLQLALGGRYIAMDGDFELYDLELDAKYEAWGTAQKDGPSVTAAPRGPLAGVSTTVTHRYKDTVSIRAGGAYNLEALDGVVSLRGGAYFETPATDYAYTRLDFDTLAKVCGTLGIGYKKDAFRIDLSYAAIASIPRSVGQGQGDIRPTNGAKGGAPVDSSNKLLPAINEGSYRGFTHVLSLGVAVTFDDFFGPPRPVHYGNPYEPNYVPEGEAPKSDKAPTAKDPDEPAADKPKVEEPKKEEKKEEKKDPTKKKDWWESLD